jgi:Skp family chaperone for outer membrane proteins
VNELKSIVEALGKEKGMHMVFEKNEAGVLYSESGTDLIDAVIEKFNSKNKSKK